MLSRWADRPLAVSRTGDDTPAGSVYGYVWRMSGGHQLALSLVALVVAALAMAPLELQRRIIDDALPEGDLHLLAILGATYLGIALGLSGLRFVMRWYQGWLSESAVRYTRRHLARLLAEAHADGTERRGEGAAVAIIGAEVEKLGGFVGESVAQPVVNGGMLLAIVGYMVVVEPMVAAVSLACLAPQLVVVPLIQRIVNRLLARRVDLLRAVGDEVSAIAQADGGGSLTRRLGEVFRNRMRIHIWKSAMKSSINLSNRLAPLTVLVVGGYFVIQGTTTVGVLVAFISGFERLSDPLRELIAYYRQATQAAVQHERIASWM